jgi:hypothetical protein
VKGQAQRFILGHSNRGRTKAKELIEQEQADKLLETVPKVCLRIGDSDLL